MNLLQRYFWQQALWPLLLSLSALAALALLTQSLSTLDLIVENRQSAPTFFYITLLALPQLISIIMPLSVFMAMLYALNRLNVDSELVVAKASGFSPWQIASPAMRLGTYALIAHLLINLSLQPYSFRKMRDALLDVRTDVASQMVRSGVFTSPTPGLTVYAQEILPSGRMKDVLIYDERATNEADTYTAKQGYVSRSNNQVRLTLEDGFIQELDENLNISVIKFEDYQIDLSDVMALDSVLRLKASDRYLHELFRFDPREYIIPSFRDALKAEGHSRLSTPLYNLALVMLALCFMIRGSQQRLGYGRKIAVCAVLGFVIRLSGFAVASAAEKDPGLNPVQYGIPLTVCLICAWFLLSRRRAQKLHRMVIKRRRKPPPIRIAPS